MITLPNIAGQKYAVLGLGKSGLATVASLCASKAEAVLWDDNPQTRSEAERVGFQITDLSQADVKTFAALILSPGIPLSHPAVQRFQKTGVDVFGDMELLFRACPSATYIGVTGTNGKSTTTALIGHVLKSAGKKVQIGGNLGIAALALEPLDKDGIYVLEFSSYQLDLIRQNLISVAVLLNITPDHLDRHGSMKGYIDAKKRIFATAKQPQTLIIGSGEDETRAAAQDATKQSNLHIEKIEDCKLEKFVEASSLPALPGAHNWQNAQAAFLACHALGVSDEQIVKGLKSFPGLAHRQQLVGEIGGMRFINDSKATNAEATGKALACYDNIYWIIGGKQKKGGLSGLEPFMPRIRHAFLIGEASENFAAWCEGKVSYTHSGTLETATQQAAQMAWKEKSPNAVVLLSPSCASFDQFKNFEERGTLFASYVKALQTIPEKNRT